MLDQRLAGGSGSKAPQPMELFAPPIATPEFDVVMAFHHRNRAEPAVEWLMQQVRAIAASGAKIQSKPRAPRAA